MGGVAARIAVGVVLFGTLIASAAPAAPRGAGAALYSGPGFDTCSAPSLASMQSWLASPYRAIGIYLGGWVTRLRSQGWLAGVYGSAASTIRDLLPSAGTPSGPDAVWIANWNGKTGVFGDPYVADTYWPNHQRLHQYTGGHKETYAGVTINIDSDSVDGPVVGPGGVVAPPPPPPQAGSVTSSDGQATVSWPANALPAGTTLTATPATLPAEVNGFAAGSYVLQVGPAGT